MEQESNIRGTIRDIEERILNSILNFGGEHLDSRASSLYETAQESSQEIVRGTRFAQANYLTLLKLALALNIPKNDKEFVKSTEFYVIGQSFPKDEVRIAKFSEASSHLIQAIMQYYH